MMKNYLGLLLLVSSSVYAQVGINTTSPKVTFDIKSKVKLSTPTSKTTDGILIPRVTSLSENGTVDGQLIYLTTDDVPGRKKGFYYWDSTVNKWVSPERTSGDTTPDAWSNNALKSAMHLPKKSDDTSTRDEKYDIFILDNGNVGFGNPTPITKLDLRSADTNNIIGIGESTLSASQAGAGAIRYNASLKKIEYSNDINWNSLSLIPEKAIAIVKKNSNTTNITFAKNKTNAVTNWNIVEKNTGELNPTTGEFTAPRDGNYKVSFSYNFKTGSINNNSSIEAIINVYRGGTFLMGKRNIVSYPIGGTAESGAFIDVKVKLLKGDIISPAIYNGTNVDKTLRLGNNDENDGFVNYSIVEL